jgi:FkbH-like protein
MTADSRRAIRDALVETARQTETPEPGLCLKLARASFEAGDLPAAYSWVARVADSHGPFTAWASAAAALGRFEGEAKPDARRSVRVALAGSYTTSQFGPLLRLAALRRGVHVELYEAPYDSYTQDIFDSKSGLHAFDPDYVLLAPHHGAVRFPTLADDARRTLDDEVARWATLWQTVRETTRARVVQHNIAVPPDTAWGHVSARVPGSRDDLLRMLNFELARAADEHVVIVDCDRVAAGFGKSRWFDDRYWYLAKQAVALDALPELARHTAAVIAAAEGLSAKCVAVDLDNTLWGGVIGEDGLAGVRLGGSAQGEAHLALQEYLLALRSRGILLAVVSKNNDSDAREMFERHPDMRLQLSDFAAFFANWDDKPSNLRAVASTLNIGLDSIVFVDDNPAEREVVRQVVPEVEVLPLPPDPSGYVRALSDSLLFEAAALTREDLARAEQYRARAAAAELERQVGAIETFYETLEMEAQIAPFDELNLPRIAQLVGKTNQFNVTTRRHGVNELREFMEHERFVTLYLRLRDRFVDHGLVALMIGEQNNGTIELDTWLMSCRVIGRTVENAMLRRMCEIAVERGSPRLRGTFIQTAKNAVVRDVFERFGFEFVAEADGQTIWEYDIEKKGIIQSEYIGTRDEALANA